MQRKQPHLALLVLLIIGGALGAVVASLSAGDSPTSESATSGHSGVTVDLGNGASIIYAQTVPGQPRATQARAAGPATRRGATVPPKWRPALARAMASGARAAERMGGTAEAAIWVTGWAAPIVVGDPNVRSRLWSMSKPIDALATLAAASASRSGLTDTRQAMETALRRSDNCAARHVVLALQELRGGTRGAVSALEEVLQRAGASAHIGTHSGQPDQVCRPYLERTRGLRSPLARALQVGTSTWTIRDAVAFAFALGNGAYGSHGNQVLRWMRAPKTRAEQVPPSAYSVSSPEWGAGVSFASRDPAFKAGWGGVSQNNFLVSQIVSLRVGRARVAIAVFFHTAEQPELDDPGRTTGPAALQAIFDRVDRVLRRLTGSA